jgi:hypothetical protein
VAFVFVATMAFDRMNILDQYRQSLMANIEGEIHTNTNFIFGACSLIRNESQLLWTMKMPCE